MSKGNSDGGASDHPAKRGRRTRQPTQGARRATADTSVADDTTPPTPPRPPPVVGVGASAGGLDALTRLVRSIDPDSGLAFVLVQHLDPTHASMLPEILARSSAIPVAVAHDGIRVEENRVYVIPPDAAMTAVDGHLRVIRGKRPYGVHTVIDGFLESLADAHGSDAVAVILSGAGSDGTRGIAAIKELVGITLAQDSASAEFPSMPDSAVATGYIDFVLTPERIAEKLTVIGRHLRPPPGSAVAESDDSAEQMILGMLHRRTGVDFRHYRRGTVQRRILRRMMLHRADTGEEYLARVRAAPDELDALYRELLINVTHFFRDPEAFQALQRTGFPEMMRDRPGGGPVRVWVAGCAGGDEAYSIAMLLVEFLDNERRDTGIQIFATDLSEAAIARARAGLYPATIEADVSAERLRRFFVREPNGAYRVTRALRDRCVFATQNLVADPPFSQLDLISCRNVLIYFEPSLQERVIPTLHYALKPNGLLLLGAAESAGAASGPFIPFDKQHRIYKPQPGRPRSLGADAVARRDPLGAFTPQASAGVVDPLRGDTVRRDADRAVLDRFGPPGVVLNARFEIVQFRGETAPYLQHLPGAASLEVLNLVRPELAPRLRAALEQCALQGSTVVDAAPARVRAGGSDTSLTIVPFRSGKTERFYLVLFEPASRVRPVTPPIARAKTPTRRGSGNAASEAAALREELATVRRHLQDIVDQYEAANEELRAANEEIQSSNEELQSTNEELETTKEEVQSTNEELTTLNEEMNHRNRELSAISADLANVFSSTQIPIVIVDAALSLRRYTPTVERLMRVIPTDAGRALGDIRLRFTLPDLEERVRAVVSTLEINQIDVQDETGRWWALTIRPYLTVERKVDGATLVFTDVDAVKRSGQLSEQTSESRRLLLVDAESARAEAAAANLAKVSFLANMSHDLRTPLNAITGYADLMELGVHGALTENQATDLARIKRSARHLLSLINDILNFAKLEHGRVDLAVAPVQLEPLVAELEELVYPQMKARGLTLTQSCAGAVRADPEKLMQVLLNLITNAVKFTRVGGVSLRCTGTDDTVSLHVSDTGAGIAADQLERIFEPFIQVNRSLTNVQHEGVGLGLAISRELARAMGGDITVQSTLGRGSTFTLTLPRAT